MATCSHCSAAVPIDEQHRLLRQAAEATRAKRREVEKVMRRRYRGVRSRVRRAYAYTVIPGAVVGVPVAFAFTQSDYGWFAREWVVLAGILPFMVTLLPWLIMWAQGNPDSYLQALGRELRPAPRRPDAVGFDCGVCGAPLEVEADAYSATCDYCRSDSWVRESPGGYDHAAEGRREAANLSDLLGAEDFRQFDIRLLLVVYSTVTSAACALFWLFLPGRVQLDESNYRSGVNYEYALVGRPGPVRDLALAGDRLVALGSDGRVLEYVETLWPPGLRTWRSIDGAPEFRAVAANGDHVLLVGLAGKAAWLQDGELVAIDIGLDSDLSDAWVGKDGSAAVVGAAGTSALFDGKTWKVLEKTNDNDLLGVWGRNVHELWAVGGVSVWRRSGARWEGAFLDGLPRPIAVGGTADDIYVVTRPLEEGDGDDMVFRCVEDKWQIFDVSKRPYAALGVANGRVALVGPQGWVTQRSDGDVVLPEPSPGAGDLHAAVFLDAALVVGGDDGVFRRTP